MASDVITIGSLSALILNIFFIFKIWKTETLSVSADIHHLSDMHDKIIAFKDRFRLTEKQKFAFQLACEEVFAIYCELNPTNANLSFRWKYHPDYIITEISAQGKLNDIDISPDPAQFSKLSEENLQELGLYLLAKVATNIEYIQIAGYNYVQFRI